MRGSVEDSGQDTDLESSIDLAEFCICAGEM